MIGRKVVGGIRSLVNTRGLQLDCVMVLHEALFIPLFLYGSEKIIGEEKKRSRIRVLLMNSFRGLLSIRRME